MRLDGTPKKILKKCSKTPKFPKKDYGVPIFHLVLFNEPIVEKWGDEKTRKGLNKSLELGIARLKTIEFNEKINGKVEDKSPVGAYGQRMYFEALQRALHMEATPAQDIRNR